MSAGAQEVFTQRGAGRDNDLHRIGVDDGAGRAVEGGVGKGIRRQREKREEAEKGDGEGSCDGGRLQRI